jgi:hypothetical protein
MRIIKLSYIISGIMLMVFAFVTSPHPSTYVPQYAWIITLIAWGLGLELIAFTDISDKDEGGREMIPKYDKGRKAIGVRVSEFTEKLTKSSPITQGSLSTMVDYGLDIPCGHTVEFKEAGSHD